MSLRLKQLNGSEIVFSDPLNQQHQAFAKTTPVRFNLGGKRYATSRENLRVAVPTTVVDGDREFIHIDSGKLELFAINATGKIEVLRQLNQLITQMIEEEFLHGATLPLDIQLSTDAASGP